MPTVSAAGSKRLLTLHDIGVKQSQYTIIKHISLSIDRNEIVTIIGPNGAGKSTLAKVVLGLLKPTSGKVDLSVELTIGYVPQLIDFDPALPISVKYFLQLRQPCTTEKINQVLHQVGVKSSMDMPLSQLSGGEIRRILLARAVLKPPDLLILDEPTAGVDNSGQNDLFTFIQTIRDNHHCGVLLISHDLHIVMAATDKVICLNHHVCCTGTPKDVSSHPEFVALFGHHHAKNLAVYHHDHKDIPSCTSDNYTAPVTQHKNQNG